MSADSSCFQVSESIKLKKQMQIFNVIFEKNRSMHPTHFLRFSKVAVRVETFRSPFFYATSEKRIFEKFTSVTEMRNFSRNSSAALYRHFGLKKNCKAHGLIFADFFVFLNFLWRFRFDLFGIFTWVVELQ